MNCETRRATPGELLSRWRFLVVEDQGFQRWMLEDTLRQMGAREVRGVGDGAEALGLLRRGEAFDVVVTDIDMPGVDGMEFIRHVGESALAARLVVCSGLGRSLLASVETMADAYGVRLLGTIAKPVTAARLGEVLLRESPPRAAPAEIPLSPADFERGLALSQFEAYFQPKAELRSGRTVGVEALARWNHPVHGLLGAHRFIPAMESAGFIDRLTDAILDQALAACASWRSAGLDASVSVNVSLALNGSDGVLADRFAHAAGRHWLRPSQVVAEVPEAAWAAHPGRALEDLSRLRMRGFGVSIDDFGDGVSSLQQLAHIAVSEIKLDPAFVRGAGARQASRVLLESTLDMARRLGVRVVAEGVETQREWDLLRELGCHAAQGYYVAAPMPAGEFLAWCRTEPRRDAP